MSDTQMDETKPLISLRGITKEYKNGQSSSVVLHGIDLDIHRGEFIAIVGSSGSGKSTLMNIIGCLDTPTSGSYKLVDKDVALMNKEELSKQRRTLFGFVFQSYNLIHSLTALQNVEMPAIYSRVPKDLRKIRAQKLLGELGLSHREEYYPSELSGGQQQRVSIARALINGGEIILADEPTGALDSKSGKEVMALLKELSERGYTIILITHDNNVAKEAHRVIEIKDGYLMQNPPPQPTSHTRDITEIPAHNSRLTELIESTHSALNSLRMNIVRTLLTLLGIVIGVASVIAMLAIGDGAKESVLKRISSMGTNLLIIRPGMPNTRGRSDISTLVIEDAYTINRVDNVLAAVPETKKSITIRYKNSDQSSTLNATTSDYPLVRNWELASGSFFTEEDEQNIAKVAVIGQSVKTALFGEREALGEFIIIDNILFQIIGIMSKRGASAFGEDEDDVVLTPFSTGSLHLIGEQKLRNITVALEELSIMDETEKAIGELLIQRHNMEDFRIRNMASLIEDATATQNTLTILLGSIAAISLLVGGIGVMNIMLVSVTERTKEIGVRMACGARQNDILGQFLIESLVVSAFGGVLGVLIGLGVSLAAEYLDMPISYSLTPILLAFASAFFTGLIFGYLPAKKASNLSPVLALASE